ncbi:cytochrome P450 [Amycolatopsis ultiminotia]|uniref:Cytochrome P450 n=1 Tax=Amycolatopsis ultiminotia TaxID=543629 RepID=A0ABP6XT15_9PSEU
MTETTGRAGLEFPLRRECPFAPPPDYRRIREEHPVQQVRLGGTRRAWVVSRHEHVRAVLTDQRHFTANRQHPEFPSQVPIGEARPGDVRPLLSLDGAEHNRARRGVLSEFTFRQLEGLRPRSQQIVDARIDALLAAGKPADLVEQVSLPVPSLVICELLGVPYADHAYFEAKTLTLLRRTTSHEQRRATFGEVSAYLTELIAKKETDPQDDLLSRQIAKRRAEGSYRPDELTALALLLLVAGHETTANMISLSVLALLADPARRAAAFAGPGSIQATVEELLRYFTIIDIIPRLCVADTEIGGVPVRAGDGVLVLAHAANRDPRVFSEPDVFDAGRGGRQHLAFGFGPHQCLGQNLARMELEIVLETLFRRVPQVRPADDPEALPFKDDAVIFGLYRLPVTW